jgi:hypothetical protein
MPATADVNEQTRELVKEIYAAALSGDVEKFLSFVSPDVVIEEPAFLPHGGTYNGLDGLQGLFGHLTTTFDFPNAGIEHFMVAGEHYCAIGAVPLVEDQRLFTFAEQGRISGGKLVYLRIFVHDMASMQPVT